MFGGNRRRFRRRRTEGKMKKKNTNHVQHKGLVKRIKGCLKKAARNALVRRTVLILIIRGAGWLLKRLPRHGGPDLSP